MKWKKWERFKLSISICGAVSKFCDASRVWNLFLKIAEYIEIPNLNELKLEL